MFQPLKYLAIGVFCIEEKPGDPTFLLTCEKREERDLNCMLRHTYGKGAKLGSGLCKNEFNVYIVHFENVDEGKLSLGEVGTPVATMPTTKPASIAISSLAAVCKLPATHEGSCSGAGFEGDWPKNEKGELIGACLKPLSKGELDA